MKALLSATAAIATLALGGLCGIASAADNGFYLGLGAARSDFKVGDALKSKDNGYKLIAGVRLLHLFGKAGISSSTNKLRNPDLPNYRQSDRRSGFAWDAGAQAHFGSLLYTFL